MSKECAFMMIPVLFLFFACHSNNQSAQVSDADTTVTKSPLEKVPMYRTEVKKEPIAEYEEKLKSNLNNWSFSVRLYETQKTFYYLIKMQYEEVTGEDTLKLPNLGTMPKPGIQKGNDKYSCVLGFMDVQNKFNAYKLVSIEDGNIKLTTLKHYSGALYSK